MGDAPKWGAYQEYSIALASLTFALGPNTSFEDAATLPLAVGTAFIGLYKRLEVKPLPDFSGSAKTDPHKPIVIYGASSSVGSFAVQLAKLSGLFVVGIAGAGGAYAKSLGADVVVDYRGKSSEQILEAVKGSIPDPKDLHHVCKYICMHSLSYALMMRPLHLSRVYPAVCGSSQTQWRQGHYSPRSEGRSGALG